MISDEGLNNVLIKPMVSIREALRQMDKAALQVLVVINNENKLLGIVTDGDVRRALIKGIDLKEHISSIMTKNPISMLNSRDKNKALELMKKNVIRHIPIIDENDKIIGLFLWSDFLKNGEVTYSQKDTPVVIMAGGKGTRLDPFTKILPKPLIPIGEKPIIQIIMDNFKKYGFNRFIISLNYKAEIIKTYFLDYPSAYEITYTQEKEYLGTAGGLSLAKDKLSGTFIVSNCDVIVDANFDDLLNCHKQNAYQVTVLGVVRHIKIPYGVLRMENSDLDEIIERPDYHVIVNSGIYVLEPEVMELIPEHRAIDMPDLLLLAKKKGMKIQVFPVNCSWFDIGEWEEYKEAIDYINKYGERLI